MSGTARDHGGGLDAARARWGGTRSDWLDLSTGINRRPYPLPDLPADAWTALPDAGAAQALTRAARRFWHVAPDLGVLAAPGASALIASLPGLLPPGRVAIPAPTYNEHGAAFAAAGWQVVTEGPAEARVIVHPNNPDGARFTGAALDSYRLLVIDESFCDAEPHESLMALAHRPGVVVLKSFGKFWGLAGVRLGFAIALPETLARLSDRLGPWPVSGPALCIGTAALSDLDWAERTRAQLAADARRLDKLMRAGGARELGGTALFRLYDTADATAWRDRLAARRIWSRVFPYSTTWLRLGLPGAEAEWQRLEQAVGVVT